MTDARGLVQTWIKHQHLPKDSKDGDALFWAWQQLTDMCEEDPETAWNVIQEILVTDQSNNILASVGAGPFEDLMARHGAQFIDRVERGARSEKAFRRMLGTVWKTQIAEDVWGRIQKIAPQSW